jgi:ubiquinone/menaquinone biosynthesis C-methylase UbiE
MMLTNLVHLLYRTLALKLSGENSDHASDYNAAAATYDEYYCRHLSGNSQALMERLPLKRHMQVVDLACGTGFFSHRIAQRIGNQGQLTAVDLSAGMLEVNRRNAQAMELNNISFVQADALAFLRQLEPGSVDGVVCGWGICYMNHAALRSEIERVVRPGGFIGIIENRANTLKAVSNLFEKIMLRHPDALVKNMDIKLPKDHRYLLKTFCKGVFKPIHAWDDTATIPCGNGREVVDYMVKSGASAGFLDALDKRKIDAVLADFIRVADIGFGKGAALAVRHESCALLATRG